MATANNLMTTSNNVMEISSEANTFRVLQQTLYPGSTDQEVAMILDYCRARKIDPILKPVHLVPMDVKTNQKDKDGKFIYERKNVIMPGIGLYRIDASRSGQYAGMSEPEFGEEVMEQFGDKVKKSVTYPKWCKITVKKMLDNQMIVEFTAKEFWKENYKTKSKWDNSPNDMWEKRAYGQLAKCAEAQALRKAFPDVVGNEYTMEEMEGLHHEQKPKREEKVIEHSEPNSVKVADLPVENHEIEKDLLNITWAETVDSLKDVYTAAYKYWMNKKDKVNMAKLVEAKDKQMLAIESTLNINAETGEINENA